MTKSIKFPAAPIFPWYVRLVSVALWSIGVYLLMTENLEWVIWVEFVTLFIVGLFFATAHHGTEVDGDAWKINNYWVVFGFRINNFQSLPGIEAVYIAKEYKQTSSTAGGDTSLYGVYLLANSKDRILLHQAKVQKAKEIGLQAGDLLGKPVHIGDKTGFKPLKR